MESQSLRLETFSLEALRLPTFKKTTFHTLLLPFTAQSIKILGSMSVKVLSSKASKRKEKSCLSQSKTPKHRKLEII